jgi:hypothetical protein
MKNYENLWKSMEGSSWQSMDINGNCHNSLEVHGCPRKRVDISPFINAALNGEVKQMLSFLTNLIPKPASRPHDTAHGPTAGVPDVPGPG